MPLAHNEAEAKKVELNPQYCSWPPTEAVVHSAVDYFSRVLIYSLWVRIEDKYVTTYS